MSAIARLDNSIDIWLTYSWCSVDHGICGHTYEVIDYWYILKDHMNVGIILCEDIDLELAISSKYNFTEREVKELLESVVFLDKPKVVTGGKSILFTDGGIVNTKNITLIYDKIYYMACGNKSIKDNDKDNVYILQDDRVYDTPTKNGIHYTKKILFDRLKKPTQSPNRTLVYGTKNCRDVSSYEDLQKYGELLIITNEENKPRGLVSLTPPVDNLFDLFSTYVYTPVSRKWDCSPRFLAECVYFGKEVIFHNIDYWDEDHGLRVRWNDIQNNIESLSLTHNDSLIGILND